MTQRQQSTRSKFDVFLAVEESSPSPERSRWDAHIVRIAFHGPLDLAKFPFKGMGENWFADELSDELHRYNSESDNGHEVAVKALKKAIDKPELYNLSINEPFYFHPAMVLKYLTELMRVCMNCFDIFGDRPTQVRDVRSLIHLFEDKVDSALRNANVPIRSERFIRRQLRNLRNKFREYESNFRGSLMRFTR